MLYGFIMFLFKHIRSHTKCDGFNIVSLSMVAFSSGYSKAINKRQSQKRIIIISIKLIIS